MKRTLDALNLEITTCHNDTTDEPRFWVRYIASFPQQLAGIHDVSVAMARAMGKRKLVKWLAEQLATTITSKLHDTILTEAEPRLRRALPRRMRSLR